MRHEIEYPLDRDLTKGEMHAPAEVNAIRAADARGPRAGRIARKLQRDARAARRTRVKGRRRAARRGSLALVLLFVFALPAMAQEPTTPTSRLAWDHELADADTFDWFATVDMTTATQVQNVGCVPALPAFEWTCEGDLPPLMTGPHDISVIARRIVNGVAFDSVPSTPVSIVFDALPSSPQNTRIVHD